MKGKAGTRTPLSLCCPVPQVKHTAYLLRDEEPKGLTFISLSCAHPFLSASAARLVGARDATVYVAAIVDGGEHNAGLTALPSDEACGVGSGILGQNFRKALPQEKGSLVL